ncbi:MAG TPA: DUF433 domain-containing protein [Anaerolineae bacterium]|nr:DUF433 domain-containing protein [Anaerolineae bacterium]
MFELDRITFDPNVMGGRACIRGMRITVSLIVNLVANGMTIEEIIDEYPDLEPEDIQQALRYAAWATAEDGLHPRWSSGMKLLADMGVASSTIASVRARKLYVEGESHEGQTAILTSDPN